VLQKGIKKNSEWEEPVLQFCCDTKTNKGGNLIRYEQDNTRHALSSIAVELCEEKRGNKSSHQVQNKQTIHIPLAEPV